MSDIDESIDEHTEDRKSTELCLQSDAMAMLPHDGMIFYISKNNVQNKKYDTVGFYIDRLGYCHAISRHSIYGTVILREMGINQ